MIAYLQVDHDIEVVGWGEEDGVPFWHIRNSWGTFWGELGFFRLERGKNALQIESGDCWCALCWVQDAQCKMTALDRCLQVMSCCADFPLSHSVQRLAEPDYEMEKDVRDGDYEGSMVRPSECCADKEWVEPLLATIVHLQSETSCVAV
jgi:Papain family cysteine protease